jgi:hypothetical protein
MPGRGAPLDRPTALASLTEALRRRFPDAELAYRESPDGLRGYLDVVTSCEDDFDVLEAAADHAVALLVEHELQVIVFPFRRVPGTAIENAAPEARPSR